MLGKRTAKKAPDDRVDKRRLSYCLRPFSGTPPNEGPPSHDAPPKAEAAPIAEERRIWERHPCDVGIECHPEIAGGEAHWLGRARDISRGGMELVTERRFERGAILTIHVRGGSEDLPGFLARVCRVSGPVHGEWTLGCHFLRDLTEGEIEDFLHAAQAEQHGGTSILA
jgi:hypothetical protein